MPNSVWNHPEEIAIIIIIIKMIQLRVVFGTVGYNVDVALLLNQILFLSEILKSENTQRQEAQNL